MRNELYGNTDAAFLVFDVTNPASFESLETWLRELTKYGSPGPNVCLVANKVSNFKFSSQITVVHKNFSISIF